MEKKVKQWIRDVYIFRLAYKFPIKTMFVGIYGGTIFTTIDHDGRLAKSASGYVSVQDYVDGIGNVKKV